MMWTNFADETGRLVIFCSFQPPFSFYSLLNAGPKKPSTVRSNWWIYEQISYNLLLKTRALRRRCWFKRTWYDMKLSCVCGGLQMVYLLLLFIFFEMIMSMSSWLHWWSTISQRPTKFMAILFLYLQLPIRYCPICRWCQTSDRQYMMNVKSLYTPCFTQQPIFLFNANDYQFFPHCIYIWILDGKLPEMKFNSTFCILDVDAATNTQFISKCNLDAIIPCSFLIVSVVSSTNA